MAKTRIGCLGVVALIVGGIIAIGIIGSSTDDPAAKALANRVVSKVSYGVGWDHVEIDTAKSNDYAMKIVYRAPGPDNIFSVADDTKKIARAVLSELVASGHSPSRDHTFLWVWAQVPAGKGETGEPLVHIYGHAEYNSDNDRLEFKPWKP